jgi:serine/threonine protein kinase
MKDVEKDSVPDIAPGTMIEGKYEILDVLGKGGMGTVYKAHHKFIHKDVAIKMLNPQLSNAEQIVMRFQREAMASARIEHINVCQVTDSGRTPDGQLYIVMELLHGMSLQKIIAVEAPLSVSRIIGISRQICSALDKAHEMKIIHRDLKPENVMVHRKEDGSEIIKIMDFGIAKVALDDLPATQLTTAGMVFGTPHYISPEQATGDPVDVRSDLYSLGCIMYEMATGGKPYEADTVGGLLRKHVTSEIPKITASGKGSPAKLEKLSGLVIRLMSKIPDDRPSTARDVLNLLDKIEKEEIADENIATAATIIVEKGEAEVARFATFVKDIFKSLLTFRVKKARARAMGLVDQVMLPSILRFAAVVRKYPFILALWLIVLLGLLTMLLAGLVLVLKLSVGEGGWKAGETAKPKTSESITVPPHGGGKSGKKGEVKVQGEPKETKVDPNAEIIKSLKLSEVGKNEEALLILESLTTNIELVSKPSFLFQLAVMRSKMGKHDVALDAVERCYQVQKTCTRLPPIQDVLLLALMNKDTSERASRYVAKYATDATVAKVEVMAREDSRKWLRSAAFDALQEGGFLKGLEKWSRDTILFVNSSGKCKNKKDLLKTIREDGDPRALKALGLFSSRSGCGFLGLQDCFKCFRSELEKTVQALRQKKTAAE